MFKYFPKWCNFAKSGHTAYNIGTFSKPKQPRTPSLIMSEIINLVFQNITFDLKPFSDKLEAIFVKWAT